MRVADGQIPIRFGTDFSAKGARDGESSIGLQIRLRRFDSDLGLHHSKAPQINVCGVFLCGSKKTTSSETAGTQMGWRVGLVVGLVGRE